MSIEQHREITCCFAGNRPLSFPFGFEEECAQCKRINGQPGGTAQTLAYAQAQKVEVRLLRL
ncbi:MAG: hypothetical protein LBS96_00790 [Oscillospiraceae bacterium]|jgi:hypothetical protein|nr:hypothetical protein [Oscillospiraceae bacterium]